MTSGDVALGDIDIALYRDDFVARETPEVKAWHLPFRLENRTIVLVDDVLYTGRTTRAAIEALFAYGRPLRVQLAVLVDRGHRELPIRPDYVGMHLPSTTEDERVNVRVSKSTASMKSASIGSSRSVARSVLRLVVGGRSVLDGVGRRSRADGSDRDGRAL